MSSGSSIEDRLAIRELHDRYVDAVYRRDTRAYGNCWAEDAAWEIIGNRAVGRAAIVQLWEKLMIDMETVVMYVTGGVLDLHGDTGSGRWYVLDVNRTRDGTDKVVCGAYDDTYRRDSSGAWRFASRQLQILLVPNIQFLPGAAD